MNIDNFAMIQQLSGKLPKDESPCNCISRIKCMWCRAVELIRSEFGDGGVAHVLQMVRDFKQGVSR